MALVILAGLAISGTASGQDFVARDSPAFFAAHQAIERMDLLYRAAVCSYDTPAAARFRQLRTETRDTFLARAPGDFWIGYMAGAQNALIYRATEDIWLRNFTPDCPLVMAALARVLAEIPR